MKKLLLTSLLMVFSMFILSGQNRWLPPFMTPTSHSHSGFKPTEIERTTTDEIGIVNSKVKIKAEYDQYGHVTSEKWYPWNGNTNAYMQSPIVTIAFSYHQLPTGAFVLTKSETRVELVKIPILLPIPGQYWEIAEGVAIWGGTWTSADVGLYIPHGGLGERYTASYDDKGMLLWEQTETCSYSNNWEWETTHRIEAVVNPLGIRTGIKRYNTETKLMEIDNRYQFDNKGRIVSYTENENDWYWHTYKWGDDDQIIEVSYGNADGPTVIFSNIEFVLNKEYIPVYGLDPIYGQDNPFQFIEAGTMLSMVGFPDLDYIWHIPYYNATVSIDEKVITQQALVSNEGKEISTMFYDGSQLIEKTTFKATDEYGSINIIDEKYDDMGNITATTTAQIMEYNNYGDLIKCYDDDDGGGHISDYRFTRYYNSVHQPTSTIFYKDGEESCTYSYSSWTYVNSDTKVEETTVKDISVYPNPTFDFVYITTTSNTIPVVKVYTLDGKLLLQTQDNKVNLSPFEKGLYLFDIDSNIVKIIKN